MSENGVSLIPMSEVFVPCGKRKIKPHGNVYYNGLHIFTLVRERSNDAVKLQISNRDFSVFDYHTKRTTAPAIEAAERPNQMLRAEA